MAKVNVNGTWKDVASIQVKVNGVWESVSTAYQKMSGSWQEIYATILASGIYYYGTVTGIENINLTGGTLGTNAVFAGGEDYTGTLSSRVFSYSSTLARNNRTSLDHARKNMCAVNAGSYIIFGGGLTPTPTGVADAYSSTLVKVSSVSRLTGGGAYGASAKAGTNGLFAGGTADGRTNAVSPYNSYLTRLDTAYLNAPKWGLSGASAGNYAVFTGGYTSTYVDVTEAFNTSIVKATWSTSGARRHACGVSTPTHAIFAGGEGSTGNVSYVYAFTTSGTRISVSALSSARIPQGTSVGGYAIFAGNGTVVDIYDASLVRTVGESLPASRTNGAMATAGNYAVFAGGNIYNSTGYVYEYIQ